MDVSSPHFLSGVTRNSCFLDTTSFTSAKADTINCDENTIVKLYALYNNYSRASSRAVCPKNIVHNAGFNSFVVLPQDRTKAVLC